MGLRWLDAVWVRMWRYGRWGLARRFLHIVSLLFSYFIRYQPGIKALAQVITTSDPGQVEIEFPYVPNPSKGYRR